MDDLVSIIIPIYNVAPYLKQCVYSVVNQTYKKIEIILVDDGSSDDSSAICDELKKNDSRIKVIHQNNRGLSMARNAGLELSTGDWIYFLDSDDWVRQTIIEDMLLISQKNNADFAICRSVDVDVNGKTIGCEEDTEKEYTFCGEEIIQGLLNCSTPVRFEVWNKLWKRSLIGDTRFIESQVSEDVHFDRILFSKASRVTYLDKCLHYYRKQRPGNTNSSFKIKRLSIFEEYRTWIEELNKLGYKDALQTISYIACDTAAGLYYCARKAKQDKATLLRLKREFEKFYSFYDGKTYNPWKIKLFFHSPILFCLIADLYKIQKRSST